MKMKLTYLFMIIIAILFGHLLGNACAGMSEPAIAWLGKSLSFGFDTTTFNFSAITLSIGLQVSINTMQIILIWIAIAMTPKIAEAIK